MFLVFDPSYDLVWARILTAAEVRAIGRRVEQANSSLITLLSVPAAGRDVTALLTMADNHIDHPA
ncbi:hypothetical protein IFT90_06200 [Frigoribacterium sp. CFBP 8766]|uniref:hypothetical protein n=1 Tax=Frigoribacterium sp. CFBP 8766 TaxID=2775273 RepID=UPI0017817BF9|nr:hypothetical protein [Frigoribacterium sp. CFBP 8766]MBD8584145.1 hypothetical protein [Frigoribacterium sp. CFBP 8766]